MILIFIFAGCKTAPKEYALPEGNVEQLNTESDELAPLALPESGSPADPCYAEFRGDPAKAGEKIRTSRELIDSILNVKFNNAGSVSFLTNSSGFFAIAHSVGRAYSNLTETPLPESVGGTDIFEFYTEDGKLKIVNPGKPINTLTWDSHPLVIGDGSGNIALIWSSDRSDYEFGFGSPYKGNSRILEFGDSIPGNTDLYYAFRKNGKWGKSRNFAHSKGNINSWHNEISPHIFCQCYNPMLIFSSDRDSIRENDFDLYAARIIIDFDKQEIIQSSPAEKLLDFTKTEENAAKDFFPFIPKPYPASDTVKPKVYFSSNRYERPVISNRINIKSKGGFDIYAFPVDLHCRPPKLRYEMTVEDAEQPERPVQEPLVILYKKNEATGEFEEIERKTSSPAVFNLEPGTEYKAMGGSTFDKIECVDSDSVLSHYAVAEMEPLKPEVIERQVVREYDSIAGAERTVIYDSVFSKEKIPPEEITEIKTDENRQIFSLAKENDSVTVTFLNISKRVKILGGDTIQVRRTVTLQDTIHKMKKVYKRSAEVLEESELTSDSGSFGFSPGEDTLITDKLTLIPRYYYFPPCEWEYITHLDKYRRNVPYFQTGFWEVNTVKNLRRHLQLLKTKKYYDATFIELHPANQYFGYERRGLEGEELEKRKRRYTLRTYDYAAYARAIEKNLEIIVNEITGTILPAFEGLDTNMAQSDDKLIIQLHAYSDIRPVKKGEFIHDSSVKYLSASLDDMRQPVNVRKVMVRPGASLAGKKNEVLSDLRAYFGYREILDRLKEVEIFRRYLENGEVLLPDEVNSKSDLMAKMREAKIIFLIEGRMIDPKKYEVAGYVGEEGDYYELDPVRRVNVIVDRAIYSDGRLIKPECCSKTPPPVK